MKKLLTFLVLSLLTTTFCFSQNNTEYKGAIKKMTSVSGSKKVFQVAIAQMLGTIRERSADVSAEFWDKFEAEMKTSFMDLVDMLVPVYQKQLTLEDVKSIIAFYETPVGKNFAEKTSLITKDSMDVSREWVTKLSEKIVEQLQKT